MYRQADGRIDIEALIETTDTVWLEVRVVNFRCGPRYARQFGGTYYPNSQTWWISSKAAGNSLRALGAYGLQVTGRTE